MKKVLILFVLLTMMSVANAELFINGDFEAGAWSAGGSGSGSSWSWQTFPPTYHTTGGSDGGAWMQLDTSTAPIEPGWDWAWSGIWHEPYLPCESGQTFTVSGMTKYVTGGNTLRLFVDFLDIFGNRVDYNGDGKHEGAGNCTPNCNDDRYMPTWPTGADWAPFEDTFTVPETDLLGNPFIYPIVEMGFTFSVEAEAASVGVDELSLVPGGAGGGAHDPVVVMTPDTVDVDAVFKWMAKTDPNDPNDVYSVDPDLVRQDVYLSDDQTLSSDPNLRYIGSDTTVSLADPNSRYPDSPGVYNLNYDGT